jgi:hypothetical protein
MSEKLYHIDIISSKPDIYGNSYHAAVITRNSDGKSVIIRADGKSNVKGSVRIMTGGEWGGFTYSESEMKIRQWDKLYRKAPYLGNGGIKLAQNLAAAFAS